MHRICTAHHTPFIQIIFLIVRYAKCTFIDIISGIAKFAYSAVAVSLKSSQWIVRQVFDMTNLLTSHYLVRSYIKKALPSQSF